MKKTVVNTELDINKTVQNFLKGATMKEMSYDDNNNGIHFSITQDHCNYQTKLKFIDRVNGVNLQTTKHGI